MNKKAFTAERVQVTNDDGNLVGEFYFVRDENEIRVLELSSMTDCEEVVKYVNERWFK